MAIGRILLATNPGGRTTTDIDTRPGISARRSAKRNECGDKRDSLAIPTHVTLDLEFGSGGRPFAAHFGGEGLVKVGSGRPVGARRNGLMLLVFVVLW